MTDRAFLADILEHPDDDAPRLVYADWLEEHGQPERAEFIRVQCGLASENFGDDRESQMRRRSYELRKKYGESWASDLLVRGVYEVRFERGFVEEVTATAHAFIRHGSRWAERTPLRELTLLRVAGQAERLADCSHVGGLNHLSILDGHVGDWPVELLSQSPDFKRLTSLAIRGHSDHDMRTRVGDRGLRALAEAPFFRQLTHLSITSHGHLGSPGVQALVAQAKESRLEELHLTNGSIDDRGARALAAADGLHNLDRLSLSGHDIGDDGLAALLTSPSLTSLSHLWLEGNSVTGTALAALAGASCQVALEWLDIGYNPVAAVDLDDLAALLQINPHLRLSMQRCQLPMYLQGEIASRFPERVFVDVSARPKRKLRVLG